MAAYHMTAGLRRGPRRCQPNRLSHRLAAIRRYGTPHLGSVKAYLLGKNRFREVVALALFWLIEGGGREYKRLKVLFLKFT
jgi:hypothetical protein